MEKYLFVLVASLLSLYAVAQTNLNIVKSARSQIGKTVSYDPAYVKLSYPNGDVPLSKGVCTDVVIRALRGNKQDLQKLVHEDMKANFGQYPKTWGLTSTDSNIDHRRVPNLETFFKRKNKALTVTQEGKNYKAGDIVSWRLDNGLPHIGIVSDRVSADKKRPLIIHNIGQGAKEEDVLFVWKIVGHYRYFKS
ncbi:DUF1287 domain-containing protein [Neisseria sp. Ec49-e6-T10]|uniref:DUF1287 domain-containing protein n=1 Tax=Neisseria sp. Ec49-e6-T10 TaxID=3140744 RepID=UPI003EBA1CF3